MKKISTKEILFISIPIFLIISEYLIPYTILGESIIRHVTDFLDSSFVNTKIISEFYFENKESVKLILNGSLDWTEIPSALYLQKILFFHLFKNHSWFLINIYIDILGFVFFYIFAKKIIKNKLECALIALVYTFLTYDVSEMLQWSFLPYFCYLVVFRNKILFKHYFLIFFFGIQSSLYASLLSYLVIFILMFYCYEVKLKKIKLLISYYISSLLPLILILYNVFINESEYYHRSDFEFTSTNFLQILSTLFYFNLFEFNQKDYLIYLPQVFLVIITLASSLLLLRNRTNNIILLTLIFCSLAFEIIINIIGESQILSQFNINFINFKDKLNYVKPFLISFLLLKILFIVKKKGILYTSLILFVITYPYQKSLFISLNHILKANLTEKEFTDIKKDFNDKKIFSVLHKIRNYKFSKNKISIYKTTDRTFQGFYRQNEFKFLKKNYINNSTAISIGIHPSVLAYNNIYTLGGYTNLISKKYKNQYRKIIENIDNKTALKKFDKGKSNLYIFENFQNLFISHHSKVNFKHAKDMGAKYVLTPYKLTNINLNLICSNCTNSSIKYRRINIYEIKDY